MNLEERGISIPDDMVAVVIAQFEHFLRDTVQGKEYIVEMCGFDWAAGSPEYTYDLRDGYGRSVDRLKAEQIYFMQAVVAKGSFVPSSQIEMKKVDKTGCDACGILAHCTRVVRDSRGKDMTVCNNCLQYNEDSDTRSLSGGHKECEKCTAMACDHHPSRDQRKLA